MSRPRSRREPWLAMPAGRRTRDPTMRLPATWAPWLDCSSSRTSRPGSRICVRVTGCTARPSATSSTPPWPSPPCARSAGLRAQGGDGQGGVDEVALGRAVQPVTRTQMRLPGRLVLDDEQSSQGAQVAGNRIVGYRVLRPAGIASQGSRRDRGRDIAGQALDQSGDPLGLVALTQPLNLAPRYLAEVVADSQYGIGQLQVPQGGPSTAANRFGQVSELDAGVARFALVAVEQRCKRNLTVAGPELVQRHGPHPQTADPSGAAVAGLVIGRLGGAGQDELTGVNPIVDVAAYVVPDLRLELPLIDQPGDVAVEDQRGIEFGGVTSVLVDVEKHLALCDLASGFGLAAGLRSLDQDRASGFEPPLQLEIRDSKGV